MLSIENDINIINIYNYNSWLYDSIISKYDMNAINNSGVILLELNKNILKDEIIKIKNNIYSISFDTYNYSYDTIYELILLILKALSKLKNKYIIIGEKNKTYILNHKASIDVFKSYKCKILLSNKSDKINGRLLIAERKCIIDFFEGLKIFILNNKEYSESKEFDINYHNYFSFFANLFINNEAYKDLIKIDYDNKVFIDYDHYIINKDNKIKGST